MTDSIKRLEAFFSEFGIIRILQLLVAYMSPHTQHSTQVRLLKEDIVRALEAHEQRVKINDYIIRDYDITESQ